MIYANPNTARDGALFHIPIDRLAQLVDSLGIALLRRLHDAVLEVILQYDLAGILERGLHRGQLDQHLRTVATVRRC